MIKAIIFDVGGTLVKTDDAILTAIQYALQEHQISFTEREKVIRIFGHSLLKDVRTAVEVSYAGEDLEEKIRQCYDSFRYFFPLKVISTFRVLPHVMESLERLKKAGIKLAVITAFDRSNTDFFLQHLQLKPFFDIVLSSEEITGHRPNPQGLLKVLSLLQVGKESCLYVGDTMLDIQFARNAGVKVACVKTGAQDNDLLKQENPDYLVEDLRDVINIATHNISS